MCGIVGYVGKKQASAVLFDCLERLEYRGYDSCGIAVENEVGLQIRKEPVRVAVLREHTPFLDGSTGIGHTRWATHGVPSKDNAHPHQDCTGKIAVVHNGIITNHGKLRTRLMAEGHHFSSDTDTEVIAHLIEKHYDNDLSVAVEKAVTYLEGSYAIAVLGALNPKMIIVARRDSPLVIGRGDGENFVASDMPAIVHYCRKAIYLENGDIGVITPDGISIKQNGIECVRAEHHVESLSDDASKGCFDHFMLKEIREQPTVISNTVQEIARKNNRLTVADEVQRLSIVACGTSYHAGLIGAYIIEELLGIATRVALGSEFNHHRIIYPEEAIALTQSGETADVLYAIRALKSGGSKVLAITNVVGSTAARLADRAVFLKAGTEVSVAATKSFTGQLVALFQLILENHSIPTETRLELFKALDRLPEKVQEVFEIEPQIAEVARYISRFDSAFFIGRGVNYPIALEGALKLKEVSYIHAEGYAAGELKHGPLALIHSGMPVIAVVVPDANCELMLTSMREAKTRKAYVIAIADSEVEGVDEVADEVIRVPHTHTLLSPIINVVPMQLLAYYAAMMRGCPIDFPRNLAKSVTVE